MRRPWTGVAGVIVALLGAVLVGLGAADRAVVWLLAGEHNVERDRNREAARGLRLAAISDALPCIVTGSVTSPDTRLGDRPLRPAR